MHFLDFRSEEGFKKGKIQLESLKLTETPFSPFKTPLPLPVPTQMVYDIPPENMSYGHSSPLLGMGCESGNNVANLPRRRQMGYLTTSTENYQNENICMPPPLHGDRSHTMMQYSFPENTPSMMNAHLNRHRQDHSHSSSIVVSSSTSSMDHLNAPPVDHLPPSELVGLTREERRRRRRATIKYRTAHATRERIRVEAFNVAFSELRKLLPTLPPDKKLSKIEILKLGICYIAYLNHVLET